MREEDLQLLITLDDPWNAQECDAFNHHQSEHAGTYWSGQPDSWGRHDHRAEDIADYDPYKVTFGLVGMQKQIGVG